MPTTAPIPDNIEGSGTDTGIRAYAVSTASSDRLVTLANCMTAVNSARFERLLRRIVVTPDLHLIHHSIVPGEQVRNLSGGLIWWDRLFDTYLEVPASDSRTLQLI